MVSAAAAMAVAGVDEDAPACSDLGGVCETAPQPPLRTVSIWIVSPMCAAAISDLPADKV